MSSSGLIYLTILGAWVVYLASRCLRTPGHAAEPSVAPADGEVLRRRGRRDRYAAIAEDERGATGQPVVKNRRADLGPHGGRPLGSVALRPAPPLPIVVPVSRSTARRRRRILALLTLASVAAGAAVGVALLPWWAAALPVLLLATYVAELRARSRRARARLARIVQPVPLPAEVTAEALGQVRRPKRTEGEFVDLWPTFDEPVPAFETPWEPVPVPLPTYVTAPKAPQPAFAGRRIDVAPGRPWVVSARGDTEERPVLRSLAASAAVVASAGEPAAADEASAPAAVTAPAASDPSGTPTSTQDALAAKSTVEDEEALPRKRAVNE